MILSSKDDQVREIEARSTGQKDTYQAIGLLYKKGITPFLFSGNPPRKEPLFLPLIVQPTKKIHILKLFEIRRKREKSSDLHCGKKYPQPWKTGTTY